MSLYFEMIRGEAAIPVTEVSAQTSETQEPQPALRESPAPSIANVRKSLYLEAGYQEKSTSPEWDEVMSRLAAEIKVRHYSRKTLQTYAKWSRQFQRFLKDKSPAELTTEDVKEYLTWLAVKCHVAASTQNQAFC